VSFPLVNKRSFKNIYLYVFKEVLVSFCISFLFFFFAFFVNVILLMAENILSKKVPLWDVIVILICNLPQVIALSIPFSALVGALMAIGRLASDNEILAFRCSGISLARIFIPVFIISMQFSMISFMFNDYFLSLGFLEMSKIYRTLFARSPALELEPYSAKIYENKIIITGNIKDNIIHDIVIIDRTTDNKKRIITARDAVIVENKAQEGVISLKLNRIFSHTTEQGKESDYEYAEANSMEYNILVQKYIGSNVITPTAREMTAWDVWNSILNKDKELASRKMKKSERIQDLYYKLVSEMRYARDGADALGRIQGEREAAVKGIFEEIGRERAAVIEDASIRTYVVELNKKFAHPFSCIVFIFFAFPVGLLARKSGRFLGFMIGVIMSAFYWGMLFVSYRMGYQAELSPFLIIWFPNIVFLGLGSILFALRLKR
jgi:lipopolysaccharide export system permease protein